MTTLTTGRMAIVAIVMSVGTAGIAAAQLGDPNHETTTPEVPGLTAATSLCAASNDPTYGFEKSNPVKTGGGAMYLASREVKYLSALRGPAGEGVHFKRQGSLNGGDDTILDAYTVEIKGGASKTIYIDGYHWVDPVAPVGFLCGASMNLAPPGPDPFETTRQMLEIAVALGANDVEPISMDADGSKTHGVIFDFPRLVALAQRAANAHGSGLDPKRLPRDVAEQRLVVIAAPLMCDGDAIAPETVTLTDARGGQPPVKGKAAGDKIADLAPGLPNMPNGLAVAYGTPNLIAGARTTVHYAKPCNGTQDVVLPVSNVGPHVVKEAPAPAPAGRTVPPDGAKVVLQLFVAADGSAKFPVFVSGAFEFTDAAIASLKDWRFEPTRMNGAPIYQAEKVMIVVR